MSKEPDLSWWPNCSVPDCPNKVCLRLYSDKCWPHTVGQTFNCHDGMSYMEIEKHVDAVEAEWRKRESR